MHRLAQPEGLHGRQARPRGRDRAQRRRHPGHPPHDLRRPGGCAWRWLRRGGRDLRGLPDRRAEVHRPRRGQAAARRRRRRQRDGRPDGRPAAASSSASISSPPTGRPTASSPTTSPTRCCPRTASSSCARSSRSRPTSASPGTATPTAASSSTTPARSSTATSSPRCSPSRCCARAPARRSSTTCAPAARSPTRSPQRAARRTPTASATRTSRRACATRARCSAARSPATTTSATSTAPTAGRSRRCSSSSCSRVDDVKLSTLLDRYRSTYFISGEINSTVEDGQAKLDAIEAKYADAKIGHLDGVSVDYDDWHFNVRTSNTEPLMRLCLESLSSMEDMERRRDEVLDIIRS